MIGVIPNPKKSFQISQPITDVYLAIQHLPLFTTKYKKFNENPIMNQYTLEASEFLSLGVYIDINCLANSENITEVVIEIRRKIGSFDKSHEVTLANNHLSAITDLISISISVDPNERKINFENIEKAKRLKEESTKKEIEDANRKAAEEKKNNPALYYGRLAFMWIILLSFMLSVIYFGLKLLIK